MIVELKNQKKLMCYCIEQIVDIMGKRNKKS